MSEQPKKPGTWDTPDAALALRLATEAEEKWPELAAYLREIGEFVEHTKGCALVPDVRPGDVIEVTRRIKYGPIPAVPDSLESRQEGTDE